MTVFAWLQQQQQTKRADSAFATPLALDCADRERAGAKGGPV
jgi:hypothetical protein